MKCLLNFPVISLLIVAFVFLFVGLHSVNGMIKNKKERTIEEDFDYYTKCNGKTATIPIFWLPDALGAAAQCTDYTKKHCMNLCATHKFGKLIKNDKLDMKEVKKYSDKIPDFDKEIKIMNKRAVFCTKDMEYPLPEDKDDSCKSVEKFRNCMDEKFEQVCKGADKTDFLGDDPDLE